LDSSPAKQADIAQPIQPAQDIAQPKATQPAQQTQVTQNYFSVLNRDVKEGYIDSSNEAIQK